MWYRVGAGDRRSARLSLQDFAVSLLSPPKEGKNIDQVIHDAEFPLYRTESLRSLRASEFQCFILPGVCLLVSWPSIPSGDQFCVILVWWSEKHGRELSSHRGEGCLSHWDLPPEEQGVLRCSLHAQRFHMVGRGPSLKEEPYSLPGFIPGVSLLAVVPRQRLRETSGIHDPTHLLIF